MARVAMISFHTSPLARLGEGNGGGMNVYIRELAERLAPVGVRVDVYTATDSPQPDFVDLDAGLRVQHVAVRPGSVDNRVRDFTRSVEQRIRRRGGVDLLHAHYWTSGIAAHALKHSLEVPLVSTFHTLARVKAAAGIVDVDLQRAAAEDAVIGCSDAVIANDNTEAADLLRLYGADSDKVYVVPPGVDAGRFVPKDRTIARSMLQLPTHRPIILFVGRIQPIKGIDVAVASLEQLRKTRPDALLVVVGGPSGSDGLQSLDSAHQYIAQRNLQHNVLFAGAQRRETMAQWYSAADVCIVPSRSESFGLVALEAAACGTPVVASAVGALPNIITDEHSGLLVPSGDAVAFANAIARILAHDSVARTLSHGATQRANRFSWDTTVNRTYCLYNRVMDAALLAGRPEPCVSA